MTLTFNGRKRVRKFFGSIRDVTAMPNLIEVQKASYDQFLQVDEPKGGRGDEGLQAVSFRHAFEHGQRFVQRHVGLLEVRHFTAEQQDLAAREFGPTTLLSLRHGRNVSPCDSYRRNPLPDQSHPGVLSARRAHAALARFAVDR